MCSSTNARKHQAEAVGGGCGSRRLWQHSTTRQRLCSTEERLLLAQLTLWTFCRSHVVRAAQSLWPSPLPLLPLAAGACCC